MGRTPRTKDEVKVTLHVSVTPEIKRRISELAWKLRTSVSSLIERAIIEFLEDYEGAS